LRISPKGTDIFILEISFSRLKTKTDFSASLIRGIVGASFLPSTTLRVSFFPSATLGVSLLGCACLQL